MDCTGYTTVYKPAEGNKIFYSNDESVYSNSDSTDSSSSGEVAS